MLLDSLGITSIINRAIAKVTGVSVSTFKVSMPSLPDLSLFGNLESAVSGVLCDSNKCSVCGPKYSDATGLSSKPQDSMSCQSSCTSQCPAA